MVEWIMLFALGFLTASLIAVPMSSLVHARATRLAARRAMATVPLSIREIYTERDTLRAEFAVKSLVFERRIDELRTKIAKQSVELVNKSAENNQLTHDLMAKTAELELLKTSNRVPMQEHGTDHAPAVKIAIGERSSQQNVGGSREGELRVRCAA